jgi:hypothetical protein
MLVGHPTPALTMSPAATRGNVHPHVIAYAKATKNQSGQSPFQGLDGSDDRSSAVLAAAWAPARLDAVVTCDGIDDDVDIKSRLTPRAAFVAQQTVSVAWPAPG